MVRNFGHVVLCVVLFLCGADAALIDLFANRLSTGSRSIQDSGTHVVKTRSIAGCSNFLPQAPDWDLNIDLRRATRICELKNLVMTKMTLIEKYNYPAESHEVETEDGYLLTVHRISNPGKPVILLQHGLLGSADTWLVRGPDHDLAFFLHDEGYDVWMNNVRGNVYSRKHITLDPDKDKAFWDYSYHEIGYYDLSAVIDHILNVTEEKTLTYIGHSMGTTVFFILCSTRPEYNSRITLMHALAPAVFLIHKQPPIMQLFFNNVPSFVQSMKEQQIYEMFPFKKFTSKLGQALCNDSAPTQPLCTVGVFLIVGVDYQQMNVTLLPELFKYYPAGASIKTFMHFYGNIKLAGFHYYDYGEEENMIRYKSKIPPAYNLKKVTAPVALYYGEGDALVTQDDTEMLATKLPNLITVFKVPFPYFNHLDFLTGTDSKYLLYEPILKVTQKYVH